MFYKWANWTGWGTQFNQGLPTRASYDHFQAVHVRTQATLNGEGGLSHVVPVSLSHHLIGTKRRPLWQDQGGEAGSSCSLCSEPEAVFKVNTGVCGVAQKKPANDCPWTMKLTGTVVLYYWKVSGESETKQSRWKLSLLEKVERHIGVLKWYVAGHVDGILKTIGLLRCVLI